MSIGQDNGTIKDIDINTGHIVRENKKHHDSKIIKIVSNGKYLVSCDSNNNIVIFDYKIQQLVRNFRPEWTLIKNMILVGGSLFVSNGSVIRVVDIIETVVTNEIKVPMTEVVCFTEWQGLIVCACSNG